MATKKMNLGNLKSLEAKQFTQKRIMVDSFEVLVDEKFKDTKISALIKELLEKSTYMKENNIEMNLTDYSLILFIKYFSSVEIPDQFEEQIQFFDQLINLRTSDDISYFEMILKAFSEDEIAKFNKRLKEYKDNIDKLLEDIKKEQEVSEVNEDSITSESDEVTSE
jgi:hypothetical protein